MSAFATVSNEQRASAMVQAVRTRSSYAAVRHMLLTDRDHGADILADLIEECHDSVARVRVFRLLLPVYRMGEHRMRRIFARHHIYPLLPVGRLTDRQRSVLAGDLRKHAAVYRDEINKRSRHG